MVTIGDVCPLFFKPLKYEFANKSAFRQCFDVSDGILLQLFGGRDEDFSCLLNDKINRTKEEIDFKEYEVNDGVVMYYTYIYPKEGVYSISVASEESEEFEVCGDSGWALVEYTHKDNNSVFDNIFWNGSSQFTFKMRMPGGFKPSGVNMEVDNEQFANQKQEIVELYSIPYITSTFILGDSNGVPYYLAEHLNKILCLSDIKIGGKRYVREGNSKPEKVETLGNKQLFMWSMLLRPSNNPIAGVGGKIENPINSSAVSFMLNEVKDGEVLVYNGTENSFVNTNKLDSV